MNSHRFCGWCYRLGRQIILKETTLWSGRRRPAVPIRQTLSDRYCLATLVWQLSSGNSRPATLVRQLSSGNSRPATLVRQLSSGNSCPTDVAGAVNRYVRRFVPAACRRENARYCRLVAAAVTAAVARQTPVSIAEISTGPSRVFGGTMKENNN